MPIDTDETGSPGWWLQVLAIELHNRRVGREGSRKFTRSALHPSRVRPGLELLQDYLAGDPPLREDIHSGWAAPFRQFLRMGRMNIAPKLVASTSNRMGLRDFRTAAADDELGDAQARDLMKRNKLRLKSRQVHDWMLGLGDAYTIVTPPDATRSWSLITAESPLQCITAEDPATGATLAGLKMFRDDLAGADFAFLFLPGELYVARCDVPTSTLFRSRGFVLNDRWEWDYDRFDDIPGGRVAMVRFSNKDGRSEIEGQLDHLDRINDKLFNEWWIGKIQAFRQRALEMPDEEEAGVDLDIAGDLEGAGGDLSDPASLDEDSLAGIFTSAPDALWQIPKGAKIWESQPADLRQLVDSIKAELQWLAFTSGKPLHTITPDAANGSAEGASTQREEHVYDIEDRRDRADSGWAETLAMAFEFQNDTERADVAKIEPIWGPAERFSLSERADAASKLYKILPNEAILTDVLQYAPADVADRLRALRGADLLYEIQRLGTTAAGSGGAAA